MLLSRSKARQLHRQGSVEEYKCQESHMRGPSTDALQDRTPATSACCYVGGRLCTRCFSQQLR